VKRKQLLIISISLLLILMIKPVSSYTASGGIETGDFVILDYELTYDGELQDEADNWETEVRDGILIDGFYEGLLGMHPGELKNIKVDPEDGYTDPTDDLYGKTLYFKVFIDAISLNVRDSDDTGGSSGTGSFLSALGTGILVLGGGAVIIYLFMVAQGRVTTPYCEHCKKIGRKTRSEGYCGSCKTHYCRASFRKGCPNCGSNTFMPHQK
jgi:hypothetical protein